MRGVEISTLGGALIMNKEICPANEQEVDVRERRPSLAEVRGMVIPRAPTRRKGSYGIDAPYLLPVPAARTVTNVVRGAVTGTLWPFVVAGIGAACIGLRPVYLGAGQFRGVGRVARPARAPRNGVARHGTGWRFWWSGPWLPTRLVTATKSPRRATATRAPGRPERA
jgi:hypothetical protein